MSCLHLVSLTLKHRRREGNGRKREMETEAEIETEMGRRKRRRKEKKGGNIVMMIFAFARYREIKKMANALPMIYINQKLKAICS